MAGRFVVGCLVGQPGGWFGEVSQPVVVAFLVDQSIGRLTGWLIGCLAG